MPLLPFALLPDASHANLDEGVNFDPPALGEGFDLHLANGAHVQMVHSRATPKPGHRERERNGELQQSGKLFPAVHPTDRDFYTTPDTGEGGASAAEGTELPLLSHTFALLA